MRTWLEVDLALMEKNLNTVKATLPEGCEVIAVVKANAYGHGFSPVSKKLFELGIRHFAVACMDEAMELRQAGIGGDIIVLGRTEARDAPIAADNDITLACVDRQHLFELADVMKYAVRPLKINLAVNTGMNRIGFDCRTEEQLANIAAAYIFTGQSGLIQGSDAPAPGEPAVNIRITGIFSHFSSSDDTSDGADEYTKLQLSRYQKVLDYLEQRGIDPGLRHISNSGAIGKYPQARFDAVRCGALIYGYNTAMDAKLPIEPIMQWKTKVSCVRMIDKGDAVSYSRKFIADGPTTIATLGIGYADGLMRILSNKGYILINGKRCPMVGNICMDQMMVDVTELQDTVGPGTEAVIIGRSRDLTQTADDLAETAGSCMHEVLSTIGLRVERYYK